MIGPILKSHHAKVLRINAQFVQWLSPLDALELESLLRVATYTKQANEAAAVLIGYPHDIDYDHKNLKWLRARFDNFHYIDRVIVEEGSHGAGLAGRLYKDFEQEAHRRGLTRLVCEVNTRPDNPRSHAFHLKLGFRAIGEEKYPEIGKAVRYYEKPLFEVD